MSDDEGSGDISDKELRELGVSFGKLTQLSRVALKLERLDRDLEAQKVNTEYLKVELEKQRKEMEQVQAMLLILMNTIHAVQIVLTLLAAGEEANPLTMPVGIAALGAIGAMDVYYASKLTGGTV